MKRVELYCLTAILLLCFTTSCLKEKETTVITAWPLEESIEGIRIDMALPEHLSNIGFAVGDYFIFEAVKANYSLLIYDKDFNLVDTILRKGSGPGELPTAMFYGQWKGEEENPELTVFCEPMNRVSTIKVKSEDGASTVAEIPASSYISPSVIYQTSDTVYAGVSLEIPDGAEMFTFNSATKDTKRYPLPFKFSGNEKFYTTQQSLAFNPERNEFCAGYQKMPWLVIYDHAFNVIKKIALGEETDTENVTMESNLGNLRMVRYYGNHIVAMYKENDESETPSKLIVLDLDGNPEGSYNIGDAWGYVLDGKSSRLLLACYDREEDVIYLKSAPMPEILEK